MKLLLSHRTVIFLFLLESVLKQASAILCYDCNSAFDPRCGDAFDPFSLGIVNCSLRDPLEHLPDAKPSVCRTIKMEINDKVRVVRQCGYITDATLDDQPCRRTTNSEHLIVTYCSCTSDLCNSAGAERSIFSYIAAFIVILFVTF